MAEIDGGRGDIHVGEVDGVRVVWAHTPGPLTAGLMLGVGQADETFTTAGITHLVEHLALFGLAHPGEHTNGFVDASRMIMHTSGPTSEVVDFLAAVSRQVADLPLHHLDAERDVLRAEYASRPASAIQELLIWRYGLRGFGLNGLDQPPALHALDGDGVQAWARARMTRANAVFFLSQPPPAGLRLHLPEAAAPLPPRPDPAGSILPWLPAWVGRDNPGASLLSVVPRDHVTMVLTELYRTRLVRRLRTEQAAASSPAVSMDAADGRWTFLAVGTDLLPERADALAPQLVGVLRELSGAEGSGAGELTEPELEAAVEVLRRGYDDPRRVASEAVSQAWSLLSGAPVVTVEQRLADLAATTVADVARRAGEALGQAVAMVPVAAGERLMWGAAPTSSRQMLRGDGVPPAGGGTTSQRLIVTADAVGVRSWGEGWVTVPRAHTVAVLAWPDGRRDLICDEGHRLRLEPNEWAGGHELVARIDALWPRDVVVAMPARAADSVPAAVEAAPPPRPPLRVRLGGLSTRTELLVGAGLAVVAVVGCVVVLTVRPKATGLPVLLSLYGVWAFTRWNRRRLARERAARGVGGS